MLKKERKHIFTLFCILTLIIGVYFLQYIITNSPVQYGTDIRPQWFLFYEEFRNLMTNLVENRSLPFYSWSSFLGTNFFASKSYYLMGDLFSYIGLLFKSDFFSTALILEIMKFYVAGFSTYLLLSQYKIKPIIKIVGSISFAFSGWAIFFSGQLVFLSFYALVPLYFVGVELYLQKKNAMLFILLTSMCLFTNFYFFFTLSCFTVVYVIYRYYILNDNFKTFIKDISLMILYYLIGVSITMILTLPTIHYILGSDRLGNFKEGIFFNQIQVYLHELSSMFVPNYLYIYSNNTFETSFHYTREIAMYCGLINVILLPCILSFKNKFKKATISVWLCFLLILIFPRLGSAVHGFGDPSFRWTFFMILFNIITSSVILNEISTLDKRIIKISAISMSIFLITIIPITAMIIGKSIFDYKTQWLLFSIFAILILIYLFVLLKSKNVLKLILILTTLELGLSGYKLFHDKLSLSEIQDRKFINSVTHVLQDYDNQLNEMLDAIEPINNSQYYRVFVPHSSLYWDYSHNMSIIYQLNGTMTYDSAYAPSINDLKLLEPSIKDFESEWIFNIKDIDLLNFINVKYAIVSSEEELPPDGNWRLLSDSFRSSLLIYRNDDYRDLGTTYSKIKEIDDYTNAQSLLDTIYVDSNDFDEISQLLKSDTVSVLENIQYYNNQLSGYVYSDDQSFMVISLPYDSGWKVFINGKEVKSYKVNGGFIGIPIQKGDNQIEMYFTPEGFKIGAILSFVGLMLYISYIIFFIRKVNK